MPTEVKICGLTTPDAVDAAIAAGADFIGFVFFAASPRNVARDAARSLADRARGRVRIAALTVDAADRALAEIVDALSPDLLQLHGRETPERIEEIRGRFGLPVMKAVGIADRDDIGRVEEFAAVADRLLIDAKPPKDASRPGGNGRTFDWSILAGFAPPLPWLLSGGLTPANAAAAVAATGAPGVDVSSGVESAPGVKDVALIHAFVSAVRAVEQPRLRRAG